MKAIIYLLQVSACSAIFYLFYFFLLRRLTFFAINRWYLLCSLIFSFIIPAIRIPVSNQQQASVIKPVVVFNQLQHPTAETPMPMQNAIKKNGVAMPEMIKIIYLVIAMVSLLKFLTSLVIFLRRSSGEKLFEVDKVQVIKSNTNSSFFNVVFVKDDELSKAELQQIIAHELLHVKLWHTADRLLARFVLVLLWFNPFAYFYCRSIEENHEFEVDRIATGNSSKSEYASLLFKLSVNGNDYLMHSFSKVPLKSRIAMLFNKPTSNMKKIIYALLLPLVVVSCLAFAKLKDEQNKRLSAINGIERLGPHPLVLINGKEYNNDILYKISSRSVTATGVMSPPLSAQELKKYGTRAKDGVVKISVLGKFGYMTPTERDNLIILRGIPKSQFFSRIEQKRENGSKYQMCVVNMPRGGFMSSNDLKGTDKVVFIVDGKVYDESRIKEVESIVKSRRLSSWATGSVNPHQHWAKEDISSYAIYFNFLSAQNYSTTKPGAVLKDTVKTQYRQKSGLTPQQRKDFGKRNAEFSAYVLSTEGKQKYETAKRVNGKKLTYTVIGSIDTTIHSSKLRGYKLQEGKDEFLLLYNFANAKFSKGQFTYGDKLEITTLGTMWNKGIPIVITPTEVVKAGNVIYKSAPLPKVAFLYEANKVRYAYGKVTNIEKYANGKWKSAVVKVDDYNIKVNIKPSAPSFANIANGDDVTFRFVHEVKTGEKEYTVNDWVALSTDQKDYGVKNPEFFHRFYEKI